MTIVTGISSIWRKYRIRMSPSRRVRPTEVPRRALPAGSCRHQFADSSEFHDARRRTGQDLGMPDWRAVILEQAEIAVAVEKVVLQSLSRSHFAKAEAPHL